MSDRELLELAARAAGVNFDAADGGPGLWAEVYTDNCWGDWNPLTDDGDALRLAVKLELHLFQSKHYVRCGRKTIDMPVEESKREQDPYAATRRAIVRAAAEIGRSMSDE